jgi:cob(I)alamin adenosyltransferase
MVEEKYTLKITKEFHDHLQDLVVRAKRLDKNFDPNKGALKGLRSYARRAERELSQLEARQANKKKPITMAEKRDVGKAPVQKVTEEAEPKAASK